MAHLYGSLFRMLDVPDDTSAFGRDAAGFLLGGFIGAIASGGICILFLPLPAIPDPRDHSREALTVISTLTFIGAGFVGRRAFSPESVISIIRPAFISLAVLASFGLLVGLSFSEAIPFLGMHTVGLISSAFLSLLASGRLSERESHEATKTVESTGTSTDR